MNNSPLPRTDTRDDFEQWRTTTEMALRTVMGADSPLLGQFQKIRYSPQV
jgi:hypothetical protein